MKVKELIERLKNFNEELEVDIVSGSGWDACEEEIETIEYDKFQNKVYIY